MPDVDTMAEREAELQAKIDAALAAERARQSAETQHVRAVAEYQRELDAIARQKTAEAAAQRQQSYLDAIARLRAAVDALTACLVPTPDFARAREIARTLKGLYDQAEALRPDDGQGTPWFAPQRPGALVAFAPLVLLQAWVEQAPALWSRQERCGLLFAATGFFARPDLDRAVSQASDVLKI